MTAAGLSGRHLPYRRPSAHTSAFLGTLPDTVGGIATCGQDGGCSGGRAPGRRAPARGPVPGSARGARSRSRESAAGEESAEGGTIPSASRAGACTTRGLELPSGRGAEGFEGAGGGSGASGPSTVTQPVRAETATVTRRIAVVVVRCTHATLLGQGRFGERTGGACPARVIYGPGRRGANSPRVTFCATLGATRLWWAVMCGAWRRTVPAVRCVPRPGWARPR